MLTVRIQKQLTHFTLHTQFQVDEEIVVLFGPSGSGKTTILNCIAGLTKPEDGSITLNDRTFFESGKTYIPTQGRNVGYLFQDYALFPHMTVWNNIIYGMRNEGLAKQFMNDLQIGYLKDQFPHQISGGEKQRVAITRAIATEPDLLLLDEPFSALDEDTRKRCHEELLRIHKQWRIPTILVTHNREEAKQLADRILYLEDGKFVNPT